MDIKKNIREDLDDPNYVFVRCDRCNEEHRIAKGDWLACPADLDTWSETTWYIAVYSNGTVKQTPYFRKIKDLVIAFEAEKVKRALKKAKE